MPSGNDAAAVLQPGSIKSVPYMGLVPENKKREAVEEQTELKSVSISFWGQEPRKQGPFRNGKRHFQIDTSEWIVVLLPVPAF